MTISYAQQDFSQTSYLSITFLQGPQGDCTACFETNYTNLMQNISGIHIGQINTQATYNMDLIAQGTPGQDVGLYAGTSLKYMHDIGVSVTSTIEYGVSHINEVPTAADYADAATHTITGYHSLSLQYGAQLIGWEIATQLSKFHGVVIDFQVEDYMMHGSTMVFSQQPGRYIPGVNSDQQMGGHEAEIVGYNTQNGDTQIQTWDPLFGDHGILKVNLFELLKQPYQGGGGVGGVAFIGYSDGFNGVDNTQDAYTLQVAEAYSAMANRAVEHNGMINGVAYLKAGHTLGDLCQLFVNSDEFKSGLPANYTSTDIVKSLFLNILGREADAGGLQFWTNAINSGTRVGDVAAGMIHDIEDNPHWASNTPVAGFVNDIGHHMYTGSDMTLRDESLRLFNRAQVSQDYALAFNAGDAYGSVAHSVFDGVTADQNTIQAALIGIKDLIGHAHVDGIVLS